MIVRARDEGQVLDCPQQDEGPNNEGENSENAVVVASNIEREALAERVENGGADVAVDNPQGPKGTTQRGSIGFHPRA
jgi:hypothetical protein